MVQCERLMLRHGTTTSVLVFDVSGWALWHIKYLNYVKQLVDIVQSHYPERLERALLLNVPTLFYAAWKMISPWIDPHTRDKVCDL